MQEKLEKNFFSVKKKIKNKVLEEKNNLPPNNSV